MRRHMRRREPSVDAVLARQLLTEMEAYALFGVAPVGTHPSSVLWGPHDEPLWASAAVRVLELWEQGERFGLTDPELAHFAGPRDPLRYRDLVTRLVEEFTEGEDDDDD